MGGFDDGSRGGRGGNALGSGRTQDIRDDLLGRRWLGSRAFNRFRCRERGIGRRGRLVRRCLAKLGLSMASAHFLEASDYGACGLRRVDPFETLLEDALEAFDHLLTLG